MTKFIRMKFITKKFILAIAIFTAVFILGEFGSAPIQAADQMVPVPNSATGGAQTNRSKDLQFDDSVVEGMNKSSKDSLEMVSKNEDPNRSHLYHKRADFKPELKQLSSEVGSQ